MIKQIRNQFQKGEISLTLSVLAIVVSVLGIALGSISVQQNLTRSSEANVTSFPYESTLELRDVNNNVIPFQEGMTWETTILGETTRGDIRTNNGSLAQLIWNGPAPERFRNQSANIEVFLPAQWQVVDWFCEDRAGNTCIEADKYKSPALFNDVRIVEGAKITYGFKIAPVGGTCEVSNCSVPNVRIDELSDHNVTVTWNYPTNCPGYQQGTDRFWVDVVRTGSPDRIVCATDSGDNEATCTLGRSAPAGRELDTNSEEYRKKEWDLNRRYFVNVHLYDQSGSCLSKPGGTNFTYTVDPTAAPTQPQAGGSCSNTKCTYSQEDAQGRVTCYEGNCLDGSENCSLNTNCGWIEGCSTGKWITCPGHTPTLAPTRGPIQPTTVAPTAATTTIVPTSSASTQCEREGSVCVASDDLCTIEGGVVTSKKGCSRTCCNLPIPTPDPRTQCGQENGACVKSNNLCNANGGTVDGTKGCSNVCCKNLNETTLTIINNSEVTKNCKNGYFDPKIIVYLTSREDEKRTLDISGGTIPFNTSGEIIIALDIHERNLVIQIEPEEIRNYKKSNGNYVIDITQYVDASSYVKKVCDIAKVYPNTESPITLHVRFAAQPIDYQVFLNVIDGIRSDLNDNRIIKSSNPYVAEYNFVQLNKDNTANYPKVDILSVHPQQVYSVGLVSKQRDARFIPDGAYGRGCELVDGIRCYTFAGSEITFIEIGPRGFKVITSDNISGTTISSDSVTICTDEEKEDCQTVTNAFSGGSLDMSQFNDIDISDSFNINCELTLSSGEQVTCNELTSSYEDNIYLVLDSEAGTPTATLQNESDRADLDGDGAVTALDLAILMDNYQTSISDIDGDGRTNAIDYTILINWIGIEI